MSIWKSPIFYLGILLVLAVVGALAAPFVINWNSYRDNLEAWGHDFTGRDVAINGPISVRLFPWPQLVADDVSIANPQGFAEQAMLNAKRINVQLALAGLFSGEVRVEAIDLEQPALFITRNAESKGNWVFQFGKSRLLEKVKLEQIKLIDGTLTLNDEGRNFQTIVSHLNAVLSASTLEGPWRMRGTAQNNGVPLDLTFSTSAWKPDEPFKFGFKIAPTDGTLPAFVFDGVQHDDQLQGKIGLQPVVTEDGRQSLDSSFKPLEMQADLTASFDNVKLNKIHIVPVDSKDSGTLIEGSANVALKQGIQASVTLSSPRIDLDSLAGEQSLRVWRAGGVMALLNRVIAEFPEKLDLSAVLDVASLSAAGETLENVNLKTSAQQGAVRVQNFSANLPGRSAMKFDGIAFPGADAAELGGTLALESNDTRAFASWLWPEGKAQLAQYWTGQRGRLKAQSEVTWSGKRFGFQNLKYELDGEAGTGELAVSLGKLPSLDLRLNAKNLDLDSYISSKGATLFNGEFVLPLVQSESSFDKRLTLQTAKLRLNGVEAQNVALDFSSSFSGFEIKTLDIGSVEGARVKGSGLVLQGPDGPSGDLKLAVQAENPRGLLRLVGAFPKGLDPDWANVLGKTDLQSDVSVRPGAHEPTITFGTSGSSGSLQISATGDIQDFVKGSDAKIGLSAEVSSIEGGDLTRLFGFTPLSSGTGPGKFSLTTAGTRASGFKSVFHGEAFGAQFGFDGLYRPGEKLPDVDGKLTLTADDGLALGNALGLGHTKLFDGPLNVQATMAVAEQKLVMKSLAGKMGGQMISGEGSVAADGVINGNFALDSLDMPTLIAGVFMPWHNMAAKLDDSFFTASPEGWRGEFWLRPTAMDTHIGTTLHDAVAGISFEPHSRSLSIAAQEKDQAPFKLDMTVRQGSESYAVSGSVQGALPLAQIMKPSNGAALVEGNLALDGTFAGQGRNPLAALSNFTGKGNYELSNARINAISPDPFYQKLDDVKDANALQRAFDDLLHGPGFVVDAQKKTFEIAGGVFNAAPIDTATGFSAATITPSFELATAQIKTEVQVSAKSRVDLPAIRFVFEGPASDLALHSDTAAISAKLGYALIAKDMAELDRVKQEQEKLAAEEAAQTQADQAKFAAYQAQRGELRLRLRELKVHAAQRVIDAAREKAEFDKLIAASIAITKLELPKFLRMVRGH